MSQDFGVVGLGHWFGWLSTGVGEGKALTLRKAVGTRPYAAKVELLSSFGITEDNYYTSDESGRIPEKFYDDIQIVHISDPNGFHAEQGIESLGKGKYVIIEKTIAADKSHFEKITNFITQNNLNDKIYLHLHYLHKQPTMTLRTMLPELIEKNGKIRNIEATFFENETEEDSRRKWLFELEHGGVFMDWIHPFEVIFYATRCKFGRALSINDYAVNTNYDRVNATGVESSFEVYGSNYVDGAGLTVRVAKGVKKGYGNKSIKMTFDSGNYAILCFPSHDAEFTNPNERGNIKVFDGDGNEIYSKKFYGMNTSEIFVSEIIDFANGTHRGLKLDEIGEIFSPQWEYQSTASSRKLITDPDEVDDFLERAVQGMGCK